MTSIKVKSPKIFIRNIVQDFLCVLCKLYKHLFVNFDQISTLLLSLFKVTSSGDRKEVFVPVPKDEARVPIDVDQRTKEGGYGYLYGCLSFCASQVSRSTNEEKVRRRTRKACVFWLACTSPKEGRKSKSPKQRPKMQIFSYLDASGQQNKEPVPNRPSSRTSSQPRIRSNYRLRVPLKPFGSLSSGSAPSSPPNWLHITSGSTMLYKIATHVVYILMMLRLFATTPLLWW